ncbi:hypothetical protein GS399_19375 [Pedobacter sp. HMF7647]|uniref:Uncharacterized protein n=1 Tax=Hufsiella arboris TaxID=2695275 RepID=A0A7K1YEU9_9SPHI|nr:hypothetical protein [Hufsiella arboris]MXV53133.1 hypothetical protein [Hufsiella arboris]
MADEQLVTYVRDMAQYKGQLVARRKSKHDLQLKDKEIKDLKSHIIELGRLIVSSLKGIDVPENEPYEISFAGHTVYIGYEGKDLIWEEDEW